MLIVTWLLQRAEVVIIDTFRWEYIETLAAGKWFVPTRTLAPRVFALDDVEERAERRDTGARNDNIYFDSECCQQCGEERRVTHTYPVQMKSGIPVPAGKSQSVRPEKEIVKRGANILHVKSVWSASSLRVVVFTIAQAAALHVWKNQRPFHKPPIVIKI